MNMHSDFIILHLTQKHILLPYMVLHTAHLDTK